MQSLEEAVNVRDNGTDRQNRSLCKMLTKATDECIPKTSGPRERQIVPSATKIKPTGL